MAGSVTSGLGRNGPWLQNAHIRVDTRLDDGSISPVALAGGFRPAERWLASVVLLDGEELRPARCHYDVQPHEDRLGRGRRLTLTSRERGIVLRREVALYDSRPCAIAALSVTNERGAPVRVHAMRVLTTPGGRARLRFALDPAGARVYRNGWQSWSPTMSFGGREFDVRGAPPVLAPEPPQLDAGQFAADEVGVLYEPASGRALLVGAISARDWVSQTVVDVPRRTLVARDLCDGLALDPGATVSSERFAIDLDGTPNEQLERYGEALGTEMGARTGRTPSGWCSWYEFYTRVTEDDVIRNLRELERRRRELPVETVQVDDGYQTNIGDWLSVNEKFPHGMRWLASEIKAAGFVPGIWLAPFLFGERSRAFAEHPDWTVRDGRCDPVTAIENWDQRNFALDGSHSDAQAWLRDVFREVCDGWGYDYVKVDFLFAAAIAGHRADPGSTRVRAYRQALEAVREGVGQERFVLGCGALMAPSVGIVDGNRIGPDVAPYWRFLTRAERAGPPPRARGPDDPLSAETAVRNTLTRAWMHGRLWANDPDCVLVREHFTKLTLAEVRTLVTAVGLSGGMALASDDLARVPEDRLELLRMLRPNLPRAARPLDLMERDMPEHFEYIHDDGRGLRVAGLFNFEDEPRTLTLALPPGRWHVYERWTGTCLAEQQGRASFADVEPHGCRLVALRPAGGAPVILASTGHVGMGALDLADERWDAAGRRLRATLLPPGNPSRRLIVEPAGRAVERVLLAGRPVAFEAREGRVEGAADVTEVTTFEVIFAS